MPGAPILAHAGCQRRRATGALCLAAWLLLAAALTACGSDPAGSPRPGGTLQVLRSEPRALAFWDPQQNFQPEDQALESAFVVRSLTAYAPGSSTRIVPDLATSTGRASDGARVWSFTLRRGVTYSDGAPVTCADLKYGLSRVYASPELSPPPLDVPADPATGASAYKGPYTTAGNNAAAYDRAVTCSPDNRTITYHLSRPVGDFDVEVASPEFSPVPKARDTGPAGYGKDPLATGPYEFSSTQSGGATITLVRNPHWSRASDPVRHAYPNRIQVTYGLTDAAIASRLRASTGAGQAAVAGDDLPAVLGVTGTARHPAVTGTGLDVTFLAINTTRVTSLDQRRAIQAALNRAGVQTALGTGGTLTDGLISPALSLDYAPTGLWSGMLGGKVGRQGSPGLARSLIARSGQPMPALTLDYRQALGTGVASAIVRSLAAAGITVTPRPLDPQQYYPTIDNPATAGQLVLADEIPAWADASTEMHDLYAADGDLNLSRYGNRKFQGSITAADAITSQARRGRAWAVINTRAMAAGLAVPIIVSTERRLVGFAIRAAAIWTPYSALDYNALWISRN